MSTDDEVRLLYESYQFLVHKYQLQSLDEEDKEFRHWQKSTKQVNVDLVIPFLYLPCYCTFSTLKTINHVLISNKKDTNQIIDKYMLETFYQFWYAFHNLSFTAFTFHIYGFLHNKGVGILEIFKTFDIFMKQ